jgi:hypothetical protein
MQPLDIPDELTGQPFTVATARAAGVSWKVLQGQRFVCLSRGVYAPRGGETEASIITSTLLTMPPQSLITGV